MYDLSGAELDPSTALTSMVAARTCYVDVQQADGDTTRYETELVF